MLNEKTILQIQALTSKAWFGLAVAMALGLSLRLLLCPRFEGLDDFGYLDAALRTANGEAVRGAVLFNFRVGMSHPMAWLLSADWIRPDQFWLLTLAADLLAMACLFGVALRAWGAKAAVVTAVLYAVYPLAVGQTAIFYPTAFQVAAIAVALLCLSAGEASGRLRSWGTGFLSGVVLGLGYLVKEDTALVVVGVAVGSLLTRYYRLARLAWFALGAGLVFMTECLYYFVDHGNALYRLAGTAGQAAPTGDAALWQWHAFLRTLFLMPHEVALFWWFGAAALIAALLSAKPLPRFLALVLLVIGAYLQFGSNSFHNYIPLPKSPRYTALLTPFLILVLAWSWNELVVRGKLRIAWVLICLLIASAIPCIGFAAITQGERTRNTLAFLPFLRAQGITSLYTDYYSARALPLLSNARVQAFPIFEMDLKTGHSKMLTETDALRGKYVFIDYQYCKVYTSSYGYRLPQQFESPPSSWEAVWTRRAYPDDSPSRAVLESLRHFIARLPAGFVTARVARNIADVLDNDRATLYRVSTVDQR